MAKKPYSYENAIREFVYIELPFDGDCDGRNDLVRADIIRPRELDGVERIPVIMDPSPYYGLFDRHGDKSQYAHPEDKWNSPLSLFPFFYDNWFVPLGYAVVLLSTSGTGLSEGFCDIGGPKDVASANAVVDWLNGRAKGYMTRNREVDDEMKADWASGDVGAIGKSYDGSIANAMAASGVEGLKTIVPISAISSQYDWYRPQGALLNGDDADERWWEPDNFAASLQATSEGRLQRFNTLGGWSRLHVGADREYRRYNEFWAERDYRMHIDRFRVSVFIVHGVNDFNVMMNQVDAYWRMLGEHGVPRKIWLHQYGHDDPFDVRHDAWIGTLTRWFDYWLKGMDNGIMDEPQACIEDSDGNWREYAGWPVQGTAMHRFVVNAGTDSNPGVLVQQTQGETNADSVGGSDVNDADEDSSPVAARCAVGVNPSRVVSVRGACVDELTTLAETGTIRGDRLLFVSEALPQDWHVSGTAHISMKVKGSVPDTNLCASILEYGEGNYVKVSEDLHALVELNERRPAVGGQSDCDKATYAVCVPRRSHEMQHVITRGWIATVHRTSFDVYAPAPVDEWYGIGFDLLATDWIVRSGHRIALSIYNTSHRLAPVSLGDFDVALESIRLDIPLSRG